jgi:hypothetical protein
MSAKNIETTEHEVHKERILSHLAKFVVVVTMFVILFSVWITVHHCQQSGGHCSSSLTTPSVPTVACEASSMSETAKSRFSLHIDNIQGN